jgi:hypothetical protein
MAKRKVGRPAKPGGEGRPVRIAADIASMARSYSQFRGLPLSDYLSDLLRSAVTRDYARMMKELARAEEGGGQ